LTIKNWTACLFQYLYDKVVNLLIWHPPKYEMKFNRKTIFIPGILCFLLMDNFISIAQERCGTVEYDNYKKRLNPNLENKRSFEDWLKKQKLQKDFESDFSRTNALVITIPIVVHVVHNGEAVGTNSNISDAQIMSQIDVLNEDFRRLNADTTNTPQMFLPVATDVEIEFVLAKQDPEGLPTNGILRVLGTKSSWVFADDLQLKSLSYWPAEDYLNIWVAPLADSRLGFAQFPVSNLEGLEEASNNRLTDGFVVDPEAFGSINIDPNAKLASRFNLGRTAIHETGHFLGLRHIWGDGGCNVDDFCIDTPISSGANTNCPAPGSRDSCGSIEMFQNYMDFTDDGCMNIFTLDQKDRMRIVMDYSPRRKTLPTSHALIEPSIISNDSGIKRILSPLEGHCQLDFVPTAVVRNYGDNLVTSSEINLSINGILIETIIPVLDLIPLDSMEVNFSMVNLGQPGIYNFDISIVKTNGVEDVNTQNNQKTVEVVVPESTVLPEFEAFDDFPADWAIRNADQGIGWALVIAPTQNQNNSAIYLNYYDYEALGERDLLITPLINLSNSTTPKLSFDVAYALFPGFEEDGLIVAISTDCGNNFDQVIYSKFGSNLATTDDTFLEYIPSSSVEWRREVISLTNFTSENEVLIAFIGQNGYGNNLYLDNINITDQEIIDIGITRVITPSLLSCNQTPDLVLEIENLGNTVINSYQVDIQLNGTTVFSQNITNAQILPGLRKEVNFGQISVPEGVYTLNSLVTRPNGFTDPFFNNNSISHQFFTDDIIDILPFRERFIKSDFNQLSWATLNPDLETGWVITNAAGNGESNMAASINAFNYKTIGATDLVVSPTLDLTGLTEASLFFKVAYGKRDSGAETLKVMASNDCGESYPITLYTKSGNNLATTFSQSEFFPTNESDWRTEYIDLTSFVGEEQLRIAFEITNGNGNNVFLDDIEFFVSKDPNPVRVNNEVTLFPNPSFRSKFQLAFNLTDKTDVRVLIFNINGKEITKNSFPGTLNQTYEFDITGNPSGIYLIKIVFRNGDYKILKAFIRNGG